MHKRPVSTRFASTSVLAILLAFGTYACSTSPSQPVAATSSTTLFANSDPIALATVALEQIDDPAEWVVAATELAQALGAHHDKPRAVALLERAREKAATVDDAKLKTASLASVASVLATLGESGQSVEVIDNARRVAATIEDENARWDGVGKLAALLARNDRFDAALALAASIPVTSDALASYKARTLHDIAPLIAATGRLALAEETLDAITMGLTYYAASARTDVAIHAGQQGDAELAQRLLEQAERIATDQSDGYFIAGALRHVAVARLALDDDVSGLAFFDAAATGARNGKSPQHQARALSRIATSMAEFGRLREAIPVLKEAIALAATETRETFRYWSLYEIAGSAAFAGQAAMAQKLLAQIPSEFAFGGKSLKAAAQRDVAWGLARHAGSAEAIALALAIESPRERVQALSRIARVAADPTMKALPRYL